MAPCSVHIELETLVDEIQAFLDDLEKDSVERDQLIAELLG